MNELTSKRLFVWSGVLASFLAVQQTYDLPYALFAGQAVMSIVVFAGCVVAHFPLTLCAGVTLWWSLTQTAFVCTAIAWNHVDELARLFFAVGALLSGAYALLLWNSFEFFRRAD
ncbi:MAG TPA: hypothetical protein DDW52_18905 [Planctomycetaceae bacterium]|nr:hypothetical protein [Planctomycetaceae bacterium]